MNIFYKIVKYNNGDNMRIKQILKKGVITIDTYTTIYDAANLMKKHNIGFLPVVNDNKIIGVITDRDITINCVASNCDCDQKIEDYINKNVVKIDYNREINDALDLMKNNKIKRILVLDGEKLIGVLSLSDMIEKEEKKVLETIKTIWKIEDKEKLPDAEVDEFNL